MQKLIKTDLENGFIELEQLLKEAEKNNFHDSELTLLANKCWYFLKKADLLNVRKSAQILEKKAVEYNKPIYQAKAFTYLSQSYLDTELENEAIKYHNDALDVLKKIPNPSKEVYESQANAYIYISNLYYRKKDYKTTIKKLLLANESYQKINDLEARNRLQYLNFSNIGTVYSEYKLDSAKYYIEQSLQLNPDIKTPNFTQFLNYSILGDIAKKENDFQKALEYYAIAEILYPNSGDLINLESLYKGFIEIYQEIGEQNKAKNYEAKLKEIQLKIYQNKYDSVHEVLKETKKENQQKNYLVYGLIALIILIISSLIFYFSRKKKSKNLLDDNSLNLIELVKKNDPGFMFLFEKEFPNFISSLLNISPDLSKTEQEYCAFIKLNLSTKEIAKYKLVYPKSVQNNKYRIRKKLQIPTEIDIYDWMNQI